MPMPRKARFVEAFMVKYLAHQKPEALAGRVGRPEVHPRDVRPFAPRSSRLQLPGTYFVSDPEKPPGVHPEFPDGHYFGAVTDGFLCWE